MILLLILIVLACVALIICFMGLLDANRITMIITGSILFVLGIVFGFISMYAGNVRAIEMLRAEKINVVSNYKSLAVNLNKKAVVKVESKGIIIDVANLSQSTQASDAYGMWVKNVNSYNDSLAKEKGARAAGIASYVMYGPMPPLPDDLTYIELKNLD